MVAEDCKGCLNSYHKGGCRWFNLKLSCPCSTCLIKMMCDIPCDTFDKYVIKIRIGIRDIIDE